jgi:hypothetical protein
MDGTITWWRIVSLSKKMSFFLTKKKMLKTNIGALEERFKNLASFSQIIELTATSGAKANSSALDYYIFEAAGDVVSSTAVTRAQFCVTSHTFDHRIFLKSLRIRDPHIILVMYDCHCLLNWQMLSNL